MRLGRFSLRRARRAAVLALLAAAAGLVASLIPAGPALEEEFGLNWLFQLRGARPAPPEAVLVRFDRETFARLQSLGDDPAAWPEPLRGCARDPGGLDGLARAGWIDRLPRAFHACLVRELHRRGAAVVVFDLLFREDPSREDGVPALAAVMRAHGRVVLLQRATPRWRQRVNPARDQAPVHLVDRAHRELAAAAVATGFFFLPRLGTRVHQFWAYNPAVPIPAQLPVRALEALALDALDRFATAIGRPVHPDLTPAQRLERLLALFKEEGTRWGPGLALAAGLTGPERRHLEALARVQGGADTHYLNFYGPPGSFASASAADLLLPEPGLAPDPAFADLSGRAVFVGYAELHEPQVTDGFPTPFSRHGIDLSGVEIAATGFANLLHGETVRPLPEGARLALVGFLGVALVVASCTGRAWRGLALTLALAAAYAATATWAFATAGVWLPLAVPLLLLPLAIGLGQLERYLGAARWLTVYTPRPIGRRLLEGREVAADGSERREVTVMLTDIAGFTTLAERLAPEAVTAYLNRHFTALAACVEAEAGTLAEFVGDSMMAIWGAPDPQPDHAARACRAALRILAALEADNRERAARGEPPVRVRVGINTGEVTAGNIGAPGRSHYAIVGDTVNTTQRIEQLAKLVFPERPTAAILVSARTREQAGHGFRFADAGLHLVRGRQEPVQVFRLEGEAEGPVVIPMPTAKGPRWGAGGRARRAAGGGGG